MIPVEYSAATLFHKVAGELQAIYIELTILHCKFNGFSSHMRGLTSVSCSDIVNYHCTAIAPEMVWFKPWL